MGGRDANLTVRFPGSLRPMLGPANGAEGGAGGRGARPARGRIADPNPAAEGSSAGVPGGAGPQSGPS